MLTPEHIAELRTRIAAAASKPKEGTWYWGYFIDGPLAGLKTKVGEGMDNMGATIGWSYLAPIGVVSVQYGHTDKPTEWKFIGYSQPGQP